MMRAAGGYGSVVDIEKPIQPWDEGTQLAMLFDQTVPTAEIQRALIEGLDATGLMLAGWYASDAQSPEVQEAVDPFELLERRWKVANVFGVAQVEGANHWIGIGTSETMCGDGKIAVVEVPIWSVGRNEVRQWLELAREAVTSRQPPILTGIGYNPHYEWDIGLGYDP